MLTAATHPAGQFRAASRDREARPGAEAPLMLAARRPVPVFERRKRGAALFRTRAADDRLAFAPGLLPRGIAVDAGLLRAALAVLGGTALGVVLILLRLR